MVSSRFLVILAPLLWSMAALMLGVRGCLVLDCRAHPLLLLLALGLGLVKALVILDRLVIKNVKRLGAISGRQFIGQVFPGRTWLIIGLMIIMGRLLAQTALRAEVYGTVILAVAVALLLASRFYWYGLWQRGEG
ncbi:MAG: hypothetical protein ABFR97_07775 [Thermodesulfobacteriota bacterium]